MQHTACKPGQATTSHAHRQSPRSDQIASEPGLVVELGFRALRLQIVVRVLLLLFAAAAAESG